MIHASSWPGIAVRRTASLPLAYVPAIHELPFKDVEARHKAGHDEIRRRHPGFARFTRAPE